MRAHYLPRPDNANTPLQEKKKKVLTARGQKSEVFASWRTLRLLIFIVTLNNVTVPPHLSHFLHQGRIDTDAFFSNKRQHMRSHNSGSWMRSMIPMTKRWAVFLTLFAVDFEQGGFADFSDYKLFQSINCTSQKWTMRTKKQHISHFGV